MRQKMSRRLKKLAIYGLLSVGLTGCAGTIIAGLTVSELLTAGSITSSLLTGKGLGEHALDVVTGQDCRILEAVFRSDRAVCEPKDSIATEGDFKGLIALLDTPAGNDIQLATIPMDESQYPAVNTVALKNAPRLRNTLNRNNVVKLNGTQIVADARLVHLTRATEAFEAAKLNIPTLQKTDLRKRLTAKGLF